MKKYSFWLLIALIAGCREQTQNTKTPTSKYMITRTIPLVDSLGYLTLEVPSRYDTLLIWVNHSDCGKPCDRQMYRYQVKSMPIHQESGFYDLSTPSDSIDQITVSHGSWYRFRQQDSGISLARHKSLENDSKIQSQNMNLVRDTFLLINGRGYGIYERQRSDSTYGTEVIATTATKGVEIEFDFKLLSRKKTVDEKSFLNEAIDILHTVRFKNR